MRSSHRWLPVAEVLLPSTTVFPFTVVTPVAVLKVPLLADESKVGNMPVVYIFVRGDAARGNL